MHIVDEASIGSTDDSLDNALPETINRRKRPADTC